MQCVLCFFVTRFQKRKEAFNGYLSCAFECDKAGGGLRTSQLSLIESIASRYEANSARYLGSRHPIWQSYA